MFVIVCCYFFHLRMLWLRWYVVASARSICFMWCFRRTVVHNYWYFTLSALFFRHFLIRNTENMGDGMGTELVQSMIPLSQIMLRYHLSLFEYIFTQLNTFQVTNRYFITLGARGFSRPASWLAGRRHLDIDRDRKPRKTNLWHPGYYFIAASTQQLYRYLLQVDCRNVSLETKELSKTRFEKVDCAGSTVLPTDVTSCQKI